MPLDRERLIKLLGMTASDSDGEALVALRMANKMLAAEKLTWGEVLAEAPREMRISIVREAYGGRAEDWTPPHLQDKVMIDLMFRALFSQSRIGNEDFWQTMDDIHHKWETYGRLTQGQYTALRNCYKRTLKHA